MKTTPVRVQLAGKVQPPKDMVLAARRTLGDEGYAEYVRRFPGEITPRKLVKFLEDSSYGPGA